MGRETKKTPFLRQQGGRLDDGRRGGQSLSLISFHHTKNTIENVSLLFSHRWFFVGFWFEMISQFFPVYGEGIKPLPIGIKSDVKSFPNRSFFSFNICIYKTKFWTMNENISQWNYSSSLIFLLAFCLKWQVRFSPSRGGAVKPPPLGVKCDVCHFQACHLSMLFSLYIRQNFDNDKKTNTFICAPWKDTQKGNPVYNYRL